MWVTAWVPKKDARKDVRKDESARDGHGVSLKSYEDEKKRQIK